jgi:molybdopterin converting factor small subunit
MKSMPQVIVRLNGTLSQKAGNSFLVSFEGERVTLETLLPRLPDNLPENAVAFCAVNGIKVDAKHMVYDGDVIDVYPHVSGG